jgi:hypothetical protein
MAAMIFLTIVAAGAAHAAQIGVVGFANGSTRPERIPVALVAQAQSASRKPGHVVLLRGGASPVGSQSYNFVLSGERTAAIRDVLVEHGIPRKKIVSQYVGIVHRGSASADRQVIVDATTRAALGMAVPGDQGQEAALRRLETQVQALEAVAHKVAATPKAVPVKVRHPFYRGRIWYSTRTTQFNNGGSVVGVSYSTPVVFGGGIAGAVIGAGDNYQQKGYGFSIHTRRPVDFNFWTPYSIPLQFSLAGLSQTQQVANPVTQNTQEATFLPNGVLFYPVNSRDSVSTQFLHASVSSPWNVYGLTVTPGIKFGWLGEQSLSGGQVSQPMLPGCTTANNGGYPCPTVTETTTAAVGGSAISVTPSLAISGQGWQIGYSQSPWGADGFYAPRVLMGTVHGRGVSLTMGMAFPDCSMCSGNGASISMGKFVRLGVHGDGWGASAIWVGGEQFQADGMTMPATLAQSLAPFNPAHPWNSYNPGITVNLTKRLTRGLWVEASYGLDHQGGTGYNAGAPNVPLYVGGPNPIILPSPGAVTAVTKTEELSLRGRF